MLPMLGFYLLQEFIDSRDRSIIMVAVLTIFVLVILFNIADAMDKKQGDKNDE